MSTFIISIGNKARQGKDTVANFIKELRPNDNVSIVHWADALYDEVKNSERKWPLIFRVNIGNDIYYNLLHTPYSRNYMLYKAEEIPGIHDLMSSRNLTEYWGMDEKDAPILQLWGTDFRRQKIDANYWVTKTVSTVENEIIGHELNIRREKNLYICIPDTRFKNEYDCIKRLEPSALLYQKYIGVYVQVIRQNEDGSQYIDQNRDINHPSEIDLDGVEPDYILEAKSGDLDALREKTSIMLESLETKKI